ncbi:MAG: imidazolonepropionase, partial [Anaerolineales bacterium]|nr:imidazolonepropionase [Anaerolineales bacterium]
RLGILDDAAVAIQDGRILDLGPSQKLRQSYSAERELDAGGSVVLPGFVDPHTHLVWAGDRAHEFEQRVGGVPYLDILKAGGGILHTVRKTRAASVDRLVTESRGRLQRMLALGTTTAEAKSGYGLETTAEMRQLEAIIELDDEGIVDLAPTLLGGHAVPPEFDGDPDGYVAYVLEDMLPGVESWWRARYPKRDLPFFDVFCEEGAFDVDQSRKMLEAAADRGFRLKLHADEFQGLGGTRLAVELGAVSVDHLVETPETDMKALGKSVTVGVTLPCTPFGLGLERYTPAHEFLSAGAVLALATDLNPGTAWCESMQFAIAVACRQLHLTPAQAIAAATINAAAAIGRADRIGSLEPGKAADLLILAVDDYRHLGYRFGGNLVDKVIKGGEVVIEGD